MIFLLHYGNLVVPSKWPTLQALTGELHAGLSIFFMLSGFLLTIRYAHKIGGRSRWVKDFLVGRFFRIYPLFLIFTLFTFWIRHYADPNLLWFNLSLAKTFFGRYIFTGLSQTWTLNPDIVFYLLFPAVLFLLRKNWIWLFPLWAFFICFGLFLVWKLGRFMPFDFMPSVEYMLFYSFFGRSFEFLLGIALGLLFLKFNPLNKTLAILLSCFGALFIGFSAFMLLRYQFTGNDFGIYASNGFLFNSMLTPLFGVGPLLLGLSQLGESFKKLPFHNLLINFGLGSYAFYLLHKGFAFDFLYELFSHNIYLVFIVLNVLAYFIYRFVEEPLRNLGLAVFKI